MADQAGASLAGRDYFHGNRSIYNFDRFDQWRNGRIWRRIADTDRALCWEPENWQGSSVVHYCCAESTQALSILC